MLNFWVYRLYRTDMVENWSNKEDPGKLEPQDMVLAEVVVADPSDTLTMGGTGKDGAYHQYDSYEAYYCHHFFEKDFDKHGLWSDCKEYKIDSVSLERFAV